LVGDWGNCVSFIFNVSGNGWVGLSGERTKMAKDDCAGSFLLVEIPLNIQGKTCT
jgi:hypothetical protein